MTRQDNFIYLTFALILLLLGTSLAQQFFEGSVQRLVQSATIVTLLVAVWGVDSKDFVLRKTFIFPIAILFFSFFSVEAIQIVVAQQIRQHLVFVEFFS